MEFKIGDVVRWWYKDTTGMFEPYWCKSQFAECIGHYGGEPRLADLYWGHHSDRTRIDLESIEFKYLGNMEDFQPCSRYDFDYYDDADCLDLTHGNNSRATYIRKGATKSVEKIRSILEQKARDIHMNIRSSEYELERIEEKLRNVTEETWI